MFPETRSENMSTVIKPPRYNKTKRGSILDPYKPYIKERLEKYDFSAVRILEEIREKGYTGKYTLVKDYCHTIKKGRKIQDV